MVTLKRRRKGKKNSFLFLFCYYVNGKFESTSPFSTLLFSTISKHNYLAFLLNSEHQNFSENESDTIVQEKTEYML